VYAAWEEEKAAGAVEVGERRPRWCGRVEGRREAAVGMRDSARG
jgi:hypothetical protein